MSQSDSIEASWKELEKQGEQISSVHLRDMFDEDPDRFQKFTVEGCGLFVDYSKQRINKDVMDSLFKLADSCQLDKAIAAMYSGDKINNTENRSVLHTALRNDINKPIYVDGKNIMPEISQVLDRMQVFCDKVHSGEWKGYTGKKINTIINIGIGGSDLGPVMVAAALKQSHIAGMKAYFVSNIDASHLYETLEKVDVEQTLFVIESKTFTTQETITNAHSARSWFLKQCGDESAIAKHFVAVSTNAAGVSSFGIDTENMFGFWDWVGGRYSVWSAVGLPIALLTGMDCFREFLKGAHDMDEHFSTTPVQKNLPVIMGLLGLWNINILKAETLAILPYDYMLRKFPDYLQQLEMESTGKHVTKEGDEVKRMTCPIIWGAAGNNGQHAFYQLLHMGTRLTPADFIFDIDNARKAPEHQTAVIANAIGQSEALMRGRNETEARQELVNAGLSGEALEEAIPHRLMHGNQPTSTIVYKRMKPDILGALIALYEHKVFVQATCWGVNAYDQWGVELGKKLASNIQPELTAENDTTAHDASTNGLINYVRKNIL